MGPSGAACTSRTGVVGDAAHLLAGVAEQRVGHLVAQHRRERVVPGGSGAGDGEQAGVDHDAAVGEGASVNVGRVDDCDAPARRQGLSQRRSARGG